ncbi:hypothetical protein SISSUDRAFT_684694 [Sistotremastrum suecicum HHB10207 ss-3]|uniref:Uncharacterized protein n=1 Tax=Sistotremastrum suecicum HHB10207 ss-3 TaxID=1314776 RepID=A0A166I1T0_9AGAM|nr:hypothetical protein SISSUDRAFT_684694 [Sistotremastrum suecicum HHB10207 ss-3]
MSLARVRAADKTIPSIPVKGSLRDEMLLFLSERCIEIGGAELTADVLDFLDDLEASPEAETPEVETLSRRVAVAARKMIRKEEMSDGILSRLEDFLEKRTTGLLSKITGHADEALLQEIVSSFASLSLDQDNYEDARSLLQKSPFLGWSRQF